MTDSLPRLRRWWEFARPSWSGRSVPYAVACRCSHILRGQRRRRHQVVRCPSCGQSVFVLPLSAYPAVHAANSGPSAASSRLRPWRLPLAAALATLAVVVIGFHWLVPRLTRQSKFDPAAMSAAPEGLNEHLAQGRRALAEGSFALALEQFTAAVRLRDAYPGQLHDARSRRLTQLYWQSDLLAKQLDVPLVDLLKKASRHNDDKAWQAEFDLHYRGKSVIFDDVVYLDREGRRALLRDNEVRWKEEDHKVEVTARVVLDDLTLLERLPLETRQRWIFGARLKSFTSREKDWVIRFEPGSGLLLTDADAVKAWKPALRDDPGLSDVLERQEKLARQLPVPEP